MTAAMGKSQYAGSAGAKTSTDAKAYVLGVLSVAAFAMTLPCAKVLGVHLTPIQIGIYRSTLAALVAVPIIIVAKSAWPNAAQVRRLFLMSVGVVYGFPILAAVGVRTVPVGHGGVVLAATPLATAIFGSIVTKSRPPLMFWLASVGGCLIVAFFSVWRGGMRIGLYGGDIALLGAVAFAGFGYAQGGALAKEMRGWEVTCWGLALNLPILLVLSLFTFNASDFATFDLVAWGALGFLAFVNSLVAFFAWYRAMALGGIQRVGQLQLLQPFFTYCYSIVLMHEAFDSVALIVCFAVIGLVVLSRNAMRPSLARQE